MTVRIAKEFGWEMGHRLPGHPLCQNVHGHSYRLVVELEGEPDEAGMVMDYGALRDAVAPVLAELDHSFMVDPDDSQMRSFLAEHGLKTTPVPFRSTAENIAGWLLERLAPTLMPPNVARLTVRVHETRSTWAEVAQLRG